MLCPRPFFLVAARSTRLPIHLGPGPGPSSFSTHQPAKAEEKEQESRTAEVAKAPYDILFCGTDDFSCASLSALHGRRDLWKSITVVHPPETRQRWGAKRMSVAPVQTLADSLGLEHVPVPTSGMEGWEPPTSFPLPSPSSLLLTVSFGHLIPTPLLTLFPHPSQTLNLHPSRLPELRGAAPLQWAVARMMERTGASIQRLSWGKFDCGRVLGQVDFTIPPGIRYEDLREKIKVPSVELLLEVLSDLPAHDAQSYEQEGHLPSSFAPKLKREFAQVRWGKWTARQVEARHRGMSYLFPLQTDLLAPSQGTFSPVRIYLHDITVLPAQAGPRALLTGDVEPGSAMYHPEAKGLVIRCGGDGPGEELLLVRELQAESKKRLSAREWIVGYRDRAGENGLLRLGSRDGS
ncbi:hypothetical protein A4X09_0g1428 [Tilletia walkeri]|uniref:Methionyl-tRNA formyltransferase n=1 Tax=Tilletia walkeri TaxID=117179 RepID=A0A8X7T730_9BASI|nr:hypothetical protein A4X09_0g1428 [Tilletia walkeri]